MKAGRLTKRAHAANLASTVPAVMEQLLPARLPGQSLGKADHTAIEAVSMAEYDQTDGIAKLRAAGWAFAFIRVGENKCPAIQATREDESGYCTIAYIPKKYRQFVIDALVEVQS